MLLLDKHNDIRFLVLFPRRKKTKLNAFYLKQVKSSASGSRIHLKRDNFTYFKQNALNFAPPPPPPGNKTNLMLFCLPSKSIFEFLDILTRNKRKILNKTSLFCSVTVDISCSYS